MKTKGILKKIIKPIYNRSETVRYFITTLRMNKENRIIKKKRILFYSDFIKEGDLCFDVGANFGNRTNIFLTLGAKVIAIEPQDECVEFLRRKYRDKIIIEQKGVGAEPAIKDFYICDTSVLSTFSEEFKSNGVWGSGDYKLKDVRKIEIVTLDSLISKYGLPSFIKIDVEGYEPEVMKGLSQKIKMMSFEYATSDNGKNLTNSIDQLLQISDDILFNFSICESMDLYSKDWYSKDHFMDIIKSDDFLKSGFGDIYVKFV